MKLKPHDTDCLQQTDFRLPSPVNLYGCFAVALRRQAEEVALRAMTVQENKDFFQRLRRENAINENIKLHNSDSHKHVLNVALDMLGVWPRLKGEYVARMPCIEGDIQIIDEKLLSKFLDNGKHGFFFIDEYNVVNAASHFLNVLMDGDVWFDPMPGLQLGERISRRLFYIGEQI